MEKAVIDGIPVCLGTKRSSVEEVIGKGELAGKRYYYYDNEMAIDYSGDETVELIKFLGRTLQGITGNQP